jgi:hypothetical protein
MSALSACAPLRGANTRSSPAGVPKVRAPTASPWRNATYDSNITALSTWSK